MRNPSFRGELYPSEGEPGDTEAGYLDDAGKMMPFADKVVWTLIEEYQPARGDMLNWLKTTHRPQATLEGSGSLVREGDEPAPLPPVEGDPEMLQRFGLMELVPTFNEGEQSAHAEQ